MCFAALIIVKGGEPMRETANDPEVCAEYFNKIYDEAFDSVKVYVASRCADPSAYTAVLLVCDNNVDIKKAYSVENARGEKLGVDENGNLTWQVIRTDSAAFAPPQVSCCNVYVSGTEFSFVFSGEGKLVEKREIGSYSMSY